MHAVPFFFMVAGVVVVVTLLHPAGTLVWVRLGFPIYCKRFMVNGDLKLERYIRAVNAQNLYPPIECQRRHPQQYDITAYALLNRGHNAPSIWRLRPFSHGVLRLNTATNMLEYNGNLPVVLPVLLLGVIFVPWWFELEVEIFPQLVMAGVLVVGMVSSFLKHRYISSIIQIAITQAEQNQDVK
jgi:hypothetical protein